MTQSAIATAADYADAMITARKAKNVLWIIAFLLVAAEVALFFVARYQADLTADSPKTLCLRDLVALVNFLGIVTPMMLDIVLVVVVGIMLVGRLIGVSRLLTAFLWCAVVTFLMFPWQALLVSTEMKIPGVLYTWTELLARAKFQPEGLSQTILFWARFVGWPVLTMFLLLLVQSNSRRGLRLAFGETLTYPAVVTETA